MPCGFLKVGKRGPADDNGCAIQAIGLGNGGIGGQCGRFDSRGSDRFAGGGSGFSRSGSFRLGSFQCGLGGGQFFSTGILGRF